MEDMVVTSGDFIGEYEIVLPVYVTLSNGRRSDELLSALEEQHADLLGELQNDGLIASFPEGRMTSEARAAWTRTVPGKLERAFHLGLEELKRRASAVGANAIVQLRQHTCMREAGVFLIELSGTAVRLAPEEPED